MKRKLLTFLFILLAISAMAAKRAPVREEPTKSWWDTFISIISKW